MTNFTKNICEVEGFFLTQVGIFKIGLPGPELRRKTSISKRLFNILKAQPNQKSLQRISIHTPDLGKYFLTSLVIMALVFMNYESCGKGPVKLIQLVKIALLSLHVRSKLFQFTIGLTVTVHSLMPTFGFVSNRMLSALN